MNTAFLISSAIHTKFGVFSAAQRLQQTINTARSIRNKVPDAVILVIESSGAASIDQNEVQALSQYVDAIFDYSKDSVVKSTHDTYNVADIVKNFTELWTFAQALKKIQTIKELGPFDRMFKISGRYELNSLFALENYKNYSDKYVFSQRRLSHFSAEITGGQQYQFMSRLWSWPGTEIDAVAKVYEIMVNQFVQANKDQKYLDIEHLLFKNFGNHHNIQEVDVIGVSGNLGPNGVQVQD